MYISKGVPQGDPRDTLIKSHCFEACLREMAIPSQLDVAFCGAWHCPARPEMCPENWLLLLSVSSMDGSSQS